jgi:hypothetical protein
MDSNTKIAGTPIVNIRRSSLVIFLLTSCKDFEKNMILEQEFDCNLKIIPALISKSLFKVIPS